MGRLNWVRKLVEAGLWVCCLACVGFIGRTRVEAYETQRAAEAVRLLPPGILGEPGTAAPSTRPGSVMGRLLIQQVGLSVPILESFDSPTLSRGIGHVPGTALPGGLGNAVLAGHRDTYFRPLRNVRAGMQIEVETTSGKWMYVIDGTEIVSPDRIEIADIGERPEMTLITCYPFNFVGAAPQRFIVHAHLLSLDAS